MLICDLKFASLVKPSSHFSVNGGVVRAGNEASVLQPQYIRIKVHIPAQPDTKL